MPRYPIHGFTQAPELGKTIKKRILRSRIRFKEEQVIELERAFQKTHYLNAQLRQELAMKINLNEERVGVIHCYIVILISRQRLFTSQKFTISLFYIY